LSSRAIVDEFIRAQPTARFSDLGVRIDQRSYTTPGPVTTWTGYYCGPVSQLGI